MGILPLLLAGSFVAVSRAAVPVTDTTLLPAVTENLPVSTSLTAYVYPNDGDAVSNTVNGTTIFYRMVYP